MSIQKNGGITKPTVQMMEELHRYLARTIYCRHETHFRLHGIARTPEGLPISGREMKDLPWTISLIALSVVPTGNVPENNC